MWLYNSSVGRKFIMALTGACLVLFVTFHCVMNAVAIAWPGAYNTICEFLGANWYALIASAGLAVLFILHIIYASMLTIQNRRARGNVRYSIEKRPKGVEWSSKNMYVLGIVVLAFLVVHLIQFWAKMQWMEIIGQHGEIPAVAGTLFIQEAFILVWTPIVYIIGFVALWFHMNHGFWSMFESVGWTNNLWIERLKKIGCWWTTIVIALFIAEAIVFTVRSHQHYYTNDETLRDQYKAMLVPVFVEAFGDGVAMQIVAMPYETLQQQTEMQLQRMNPEIFKTQIGTDPMMTPQEREEAIKNFTKQYHAFESADRLFKYLDKYSDNPAGQESEIIIPN